VPVILVDTSVWVDHFRRSEPKLAAALTGQVVALHPVVLGELATGDLKDRLRTMADLRALTRVPEASFEECLHLIENRRLFGRGLSWGDIQLLAAALLSGTPLWTRDKRLREAARGLRLDAGW
jgi:predicted nucleic acid-binding protein